MEGWTGDLLGAPTFFSIYPGRDELDGLRARWASRSFATSCVIYLERDGEATFQWVLEVR